MRAVYDAAFWISAAFVISMFLYYCSYGRVTFHGAAGFLAGLLLWKKICCDIISAWVGTDEAQNTRTTAVSSTWRKPDVSDWKKEGRSKRKKEEKEIRAQRRNTRGKRAIRRNRARRRLTLAIVIVALALVLFLFVMNIVSLKRAA